MIQMVLCPICETLVNKPCHKGGGVLIYCLPQCMWPLTTHPVRDGAHHTGVQVGNCTGKGRGGALHDASYVKSERSVKKKCIPSFFSLSFSLPYPCWSYNITVCRGGRYLSWMQPAGKQNTGSQMLHWQIRNIETAPTFGGGGQAGYKMEGKERGATWL